MLRCFLKDADAEKHTNAMVRNSSGIRKHMRRLAFSIVDCMEHATEIRGSSKRISKVILSMQSFGLQQSISGDGYSQPLQERREMQKTFSNDNENNLVGLEKNVKTLVHYLVEEDCIRVISITRMGGIEYNVVNKYNPDQKVILTSRNEDVAIRADPTYVTFKPQGFTHEESWKLSQKIAFPKNEVDEFSADKEMGEICKEMIKHCEGLPLPIKVRPEDANYTVDVLTRCMVSRDGAGKKKSKLVPFKQRGEPVVVSNIFISEFKQCNVVELKRKVACEISSAEELTLTELMFSGVFKEAKVEEHNQIDIDLESFVHSFRPDIMEAVYAWAKGSKFYEIMEIACVFEGSMIRAIRRMEEVLQQLIVVAKNP
ncbi:hypothetical protein HID58_060089 [Brassica napus]|uniref:ATP-dependent RNA helicase Ski2/MTR4 C-terminal domain-containing protein n=1 Tax=Brassica napus TaxID=3708 RepID=A0ABQ7ZV00_BRANA|nr:hypothetical protein HID58_060089 [Brassica napus]